ncbi:MAG TPA: hypothetical protein VGL09_10840 [Methylomirabilota bacterium]|jgi:hypothetical protein
MIRLAGVLLLSVVGAIHIFGGGAWAQPGSQSGTTQSGSTQSGTTQTGTTPSTQTERPTPGTPISPVQPTAQGPMFLTPFTHIGPYLLNPPLPQGRLTVTPSFTISEEFNDNVFANNANKDWDFVTGFTPGISIALQQPTYQLSAAYNFTAEVYARHTELNNIANRHNLALNAAYQASQRLSFTLSEYFTYDRNTNAATLQGVSTGRREAWTNTIAPGLSWVMTPLMTGRVYGSYVIERFGNTTDDDNAASTTAHDSNGYRIGVAVDRTFTPRLTGTASYEFAYLDIDGEPVTMTHTPRLGVSYLITGTLSASLSAGPSFVVQEGDTSVTPAVTATLAQRFKWGQISGTYDRAVTTSGGQGGVVDSQSVTGLVEVTSLMKGFVIGLSPRYSTFESEGKHTRTNTDFNTFTLSLNAAYQVARYITIYGSYTFFRQRSDTTSSSAADVDQNRVFIGLQFGYPFSFN